MSDTGDETQGDSTQFLHRKHCANRVFIGPWDIKAHPQPEQSQSTQKAHDRSSIECHSSTNLVNNHSSSIIAIRPRKSSETTSTAQSPNKSAYNCASSNGTSFVTARSEVNSSTYHNTNGGSSCRFQERMVNEEDTDDEIDYNLLVSSGNDLIDTGENTAITSTSVQPRTDHKSTPPTSDTESIKTLRPIRSNNKGKQPMNQSDEPPLLSPATPTSSLPTASRKKKKTHRSVRKSNRKKFLLWKKPGPTAIASEIPTIVTPASESVPTGKPIKIDPILCMRSVKEYTGSEPSRYKASKEARYDLLTEKWKQVELVLTNSYISTYSSSTYYWPKKRLEYRIYLEGSNMPKNLELVLLSSLDYTFCLRYQSNTTSTPMMITHTFKARSFLKCQEWYMQLYDILPIECKRLSPKWCEVYIPVLDLSVNLPLSHIEHINEVTTDVVKEAIISVLEEDESGFSQDLIAVYDGSTESVLPAEKFGLCWTIGDRAEWIYWTHSSSDKNKPIDSVICPQSIEQTHRLELRMIEHTPRDIILPENLTLKEPPPVEGFLIQLSDFHGSTGVFNSNRKMTYFATFDQYLFYVPASKVDPPNTVCFVDEDLLPRTIKAQSYVSAISPYTNTCTPEIGAKEIQRRMRLMIEAEGVIDLTEVSYVRRAFTQDISDEQDIPNDSNIGLLHWPSRSSISQKQYQQISQQGGNSFLANSRRNKPCLEIIMMNGLQIKFEAYSSDTCDLWVSYLAQIIVYWKARKEAEKDAHSSDTFSNSTCNNNSMSEANLLNKDNEINIRKPPQRKQGQLADTRIWSYCLYEQCHDVVKSGILYYKSHKRGSYSQKMFILTSNGWILFYDVYNRNSTKKFCNHERKGTLDIAGCYVYSGVNYSKRKKGSNREDFLKKAARIYRNGLSTDDNTLSCIFSIWKPKLRRYFSGQRQRLRVYRHDQRLNPNGSTWAFLAPSRREKEEWVCALNAITEHLIRNETSDCFRSQSCV